MHPVVPNSSMIGGLLVDCLHVAFKTSTHGTKLSILEQCVPAKRLQRQSSTHKDWSNVALHSHWQAFKRGI